MDLFKPLNAQITIPACFDKNFKVSGNIVQRYLVRPTVINVEITEAPFRGYWELIPSVILFDQRIFLKKRGVPGCCPNDHISLKSTVDFNIANINKINKFIWENSPQRSTEMNIQEIPDSWFGQFSFKTENQEKQTVGLRKPQIGALHAISAHFSTSRDLEPATIVLPTGTGKTETMLATMVYQQCEKILVIVPSNSLREQLSKKFLNLGYLPDLGVIPLNINCPSVAIIKHGIHNVENAAQLASNANVIVATPSVLNAFNEDALLSLTNSCTHLFIDEAHHVSASTWKKIRAQFLDKRIIQFTATPFRNDKKSLGGKIIFNYTMGEAQTDGFFKHINLESVEEYFDERIDHAVAEKAIQTLRRDIANGFDHLMMARTNSRENAEQLFNLYQEAAVDLNPIVVHSGLSDRETKLRLDKLLSKESKIVVCVDMLGEGYDLPNLKVAALHHNHKTLAITLQFIGRFTRVNNSENLGDASVVMNIADQEVTKELQSLYSTGADWDVVLRRLSENRIAREVQLQEVVDSLKHRGNLHTQISLWNLEPSYSAIFYKTTCENWIPENFETDLPKFEEKWSAISDEKKLLVVLAIQSTPVKWGEYKELKDINYKLLLAHWDSDRNALFIFSNDYSAFRLETLVPNITNSKCELLSGEQIFNLFNGIEYPLARNIGASQIGAISFTQFFGANVTEGLNLVEQSQSTLSNIAVLGYEEGEKFILGCSQRKGKVWSPQKGGTISDWCDWAKKKWDKISLGPIDEENITRNFLRPQKLEHPYNEYPITAQWGEQLLMSYEDKVEFIFGNVATPFYQVDLKIYQKDSDGFVHISIFTDDNESIYKVAIGSEYSANGYDYVLVNGDEVLIKKGAAKAIKLPEFMIHDPIVIGYADNSFTFNAQLVKVNDNIGLYDKEDIFGFDWSTTNIRKESMGQYREVDCIQYRYIKSIEDSYDLIINDDAAGESADIVAINHTANEIILSLIHCKYSSEPTPGSRLNDLYEVCGQAQRCISWKHRKFNYLYEHIKRREERWRKSGHSRFIKGNIQDFLAIKKRSSTTPVRLKVFIVQPGISASAISNECLKLLGSTSLYLKKTANAELYVIGSP